MAKKRKPKRSEEQKHEKTDASTEEESARRGPEWLQTLEKEGNEKLKEQNEVTSEPANNGTPPEYHTAHRSKNDERDNTATEAAQQLLHVAHQIRDHAEFLVDQAVQLSGCHVPFISESTDGVTWKRFAESESPEKLWRYISGSEAEDGVEAKLMFDPDLSHLCESPIETMFYEACAALVERLGGAFEPTPQVKVEHYRLDFALMDYKIAIELDGHDYHKTKEQRTSDAKRDRYLTSIGWTVQRFTGSEIWANVESCAEEAHDLWQCKEIEQAQSESEA